MNEAEARASYKPIYHEIRAIYDEFSENEAFEMFDSESIEPDDIKAALGDGVLNEYMQWIYLNIK